MFEFIHDIIETWILRSASQGLGGLRRSLVKKHLARCQRCRGFALDLVEFSHTLEAPKSTPKLSASERDEIHAGIMAAFHRERLDEKLAPLPFERASGPAIRPSFVKALGMVALIVAAVAALSYPFRHDALEGQDDAASANLNPNPNLEDLALPQPKASPASASKTAEPKPSPTAAPKAPASLGR